ncbi:hypothetical protein Syn7502_00164 [Synechococcus sp. PCC 7502]|nr:hypothetical protein [Synechococcus sp. PCC 7502]AFY72333.1 hypothetical protein Syn7502_00164 [Synechococcus sp. PCC 7502]
MQILWFFPTNRDLRYLNSDIGSRAMTPEYLQQLAIAQLMICKAIVQ